LTQEFIISEDRGIKRRVEARLAYGVREAGIGSEEEELAENRVCLLRRCLCASNNPASSLNGTTPGLELSDTINESYSRLIP
jgi:hypothetical protein